MTVETEQVGRRWAAAAASVKCAAAASATPRQEAARTAPAARSWARRRAPRHVGLAASACGSGRAAARCFALLRRSRVPSSNCQQPQPPADHLAASRRGYQSGQHGVVVRRCRDPASQIWRALTSTLQMRRRALQMAPPRRAQATSSATVAVSRAVWRTQRRRQVRFFASAEARLRCASAGA